MKWGSGHRDEQITPQGLAIAGATGVVSGSVGVVAGAAAGGGLIGNVVWVPTTVSINATGNAIAGQH